MQTMIAVPCMDSVPSPFCQSLAMLNKTGGVSLAMQMGSLIYDSRNALARKALERQADFVLWLDSDMVFPPDLLERMLKTLESEHLDILTGVYFRRSEPYTPVLASVLDVIDGRAVSEGVRDIPEGLFEVAGCGFGCVLMRTRVFLDVAVTHRAMFEPFAGMGEDLAFCWRARQAGYKIMCDPSISPGHVGHVMVTRAFYNAYQGGRTKG